MGDCKLTVVLCALVVWSVRATTASEAVETLSSQICTLENKLKGIESDLKSRNACTRELNSSTKSIENSVEHKLSDMEKFLKNNMNYLHIVLRKIEVNLAELATNISQRKTSSAAMAASGGTYASCQAAPSESSGKYSIQIGSEEVEVYCDQTNYGGGWTVIQRRFDGSENFFRNWTDYRNGFGNLEGEFWLGLEHLYQMTSQRPHELILELWDFEGNYAYGRYDLFEIANESENYALKNIGTYMGYTGDAMSWSKGFRFSTPDRDNDESELNCAALGNGGWWWQLCTYVNLNGAYKNPISVSSAMTWFPFRNDSRPMKRTRMLIRPKCIEVRCY